MKGSRRLVELWLSLLVLVLLLLWPLVTGKAADRETAFNVARAIVLAGSLNLLLGMTGYVNFGNIVFFGLGGYVGIYLITAHGWHLGWAMLAGGLASALLALLVGAGILRLHGAFFALVTVGLNEVVRAFINNFAPFGGSIGMTVHFSIYRAYGGAAQMLQTSFYLVMGLAALVVLVNYLVRSSRLGLGLLAIREDEGAADVMGVPRARFKTLAFVLSAFFPGVLGVIYFFKNGAIEPHDAFPLVTSIEAIVMVMLGGQGTVLGPLLGATGYQLLRGWLITLPVTWVRNLQLVVAGLLLLLIVQFIPSGAVGALRHRFPSLRRYLT